MMNRFQSLLSNFNLRRCDTVRPTLYMAVLGGVEATCVLGISTLDMGDEFLLFSATWGVLRFAVAGGWSCAGKAAREAGAHTRPLFSSM